MLSVTTSAAIEAADGVRVHALLPDGVDTPMVDAMREDRAAKALVHSAAGCSPPARWRRPPWV